ncbi:hypothetical protein [Streptomyces sp. NPDC002851]
MARQSQNPQNPQNPHGPQGPTGSGPQGPDAASDGSGAWDEALESEQVASLNSALRRITNTPGASPEMQEMAKKLLSGRVSLRDIVDDPDGSRALGSGLASLRGKWEALSEEDRDRFRAGEPLSGDAAAGGSDSSGGSGSGGSGAGRDGAGQGPSRKKGQGRHSGGFSLY